MNKKNIKRTVAAIVLVLVILLGINIANKKINSNDTFKTQSDKKKSVIVLGSEPEAITAAVNAARLGYKVDMITSDEKLGGLFTEGMLTALDLNYFNGGEILHGGFFTEFYNNASNGHNLDLIKTQNFFDNVVKHKNIKLVKGVDDITPIVDSTNEKKAIGVSYTKDGKSTNVKGDFIFDGSHEAEFTRKMGAEYRTGRSEFGQPDEYASAGVMFSLQNIDWNDLTKAIKEKNDPTTGVTGNAAWGFAEMYNYVPKNDLFKMRGLNISRQDDGSIVLNALLVFNVDPLNEDSYKNIIEMSKDEIPYIVEYMNKNLPGFENAKLDKIAEDLYIREGVRVVGKETLDGYDIIAHSSYDDTIGYGSYPSDLQTSHKEGYGNAMNGNSIYEIPLSVMMPKDLENVVVLGRNASFDVVAHGSARTVPVLMSMAQGAVHAVDYALTNDLSLEEVRLNNMEEVHKEMKNLGKMKLPKMPDNPYEGHFAEKYIEHLRVRGVLGFKYKEYLPVNDQTTASDIKGIFGLLKEHSEIEFTKEQSQFVSQLPDKITEADVLALASLLINKNISSIEDLKTDGIIDEDIYNRMKDSKYISNAYIYAIFSGYINYVQPNFKEVIKKEELNIVK